jgi:hypothetical protein
MKNGERNGKSAFVGLRRESDGICEKRKKKAEAGKAFKL